MSLLQLHPLTLSALGVGCRRYVDMLVTEGVRDAFRARARMTSATRRLLEARGFLEVSLAPRHKLLQAVFGLQAF